MPLPHFGESQCVFKIHLEVLVQEIQEKQPHLNQARSTVFRPNREVNVVSERAFVFQSLWFPETQKRWNKHIHQSNHQRKPLQFWKKEWSGGLPFLFLVQLLACSPFPFLAVLLWVVTILLWGGAAFSSNQVVLMSPPPPPSPPLDWWCWNSPLTVWVVLMSLLPPFAAFIRLLWVALQRSSFFHQLRNKSEFHKVEQEQKRDRKVRQGKEDGKQEGWKGENGELKREKLFLTKKKCWEKLKNIEKWKRRKQGNMEKLRTGTRRKNEKTQI